jgi:hypothetical protein
MEIIMRKIPVIAILAAIAATFAVPASAQPTRVWLSGTGVDSGTCPRQSPCHTLTYAHGQVAPGGEISIMDPGGYGTVVITKAVSIVSDSGSGEAGVANFSGDMITVNAGASDVVILRGLVIDGLNSAANGIKFNSGAALHVQNSLIKNVRGSGGVGINFTPSGSSDLMVTDTTVVNNNGVNGIGILVNPTGAGLVRATFNRVTAEQNGDGIKVDASSSTGTIRTTVRDSVVSTNAGSGVWTRSPGSAAATTFVVNSSVNQNALVGITADSPNANVAVMGSTIQGNMIGISAPGGGRLYTYKNNALNFNFSSDGAFPNVLTLN